MPEPSVQPVTSSSPETLTIAEAAALLDVSRPYVTALYDAGRLGPRTTTEGGQRIIARAAVERFQAVRASSETPLTPQAAGRSAGLYDHDDGHYRIALRAGEPLPSAAVDPNRAKPPRSR